jgi:hypothetical protein
MAANRRRKLLDRLDRAWREFLDSYAVFCRRFLREGMSVYLARTSHQISTAEADPGMSTALRSFGLLDVLSSTPAGPSVARLVSMPVCASSLRNLVRNAG